MKGLGLLPDTPTPLLDKGRDAVDFFFTLSGFLITYLLLKENARSGDISIRKFYLRRALRIWPLYFLLVAVYFSVHAFLYPVYHIRDTNFPFGRSLALYLFFLPNLADVLYNVGLLHPLWSIGVEEQFYLLWAPLFKWFRRHVGRLIAIAILLCGTGYILVACNVFGLDPVSQRFLLSYKFFAIMTGAATGYVLFRHFDVYTRLAGKPFQVFVLAVIVYHYVFTNRLEEALWFRMLVPFFYGALILNVSAVGNKLFSLEKAPLVFLGEISYGLYMYHLVVDFFLRKAAAKLMTWHLPGSMLVVLYFVLILGGTTLLAWISYRFFELRWLKIKESR